MRSAKFAAVWTAICLLPVLLLGCGGGARDIGPTGEVEGTVTLDGKPLTEASIAFYDKSTGQTGGGEVGAEGKFKFTTPVAAGTYQVSFLPPTPPQPDDETSGKLARAKSDIPTGYQIAEKSGLSAVVKEGPNTFTFELNKKGPSKGNTPP